MGETTIPRLDYSKPPPGMSSDGASAWAYYKSYNDPPGMIVRRTEHCYEVVVPVSGAEHLLAARRGRGEDALDTAWAWYDRRVELYRKLEHAEAITRQFVVDDFWPAALAWSEEQVALAERWLVDATMELPAVLGGSPDGPIIAMPWGSLMQLHHDAVHALKHATDGLLALETEIRRRLDLPPCSATASVAATKADIRDVARQRKARILAERAATTQRDVVARHDINKCIDTNDPHNVILDYSKPPPCMSGDGVVLWSAWGYYKTSHDPPGCSEIFRCGGLDGGRIVRGWKFRFGIASNETLYVDRQPACAAAWAWHDRRLVAHKRVANDSRRQIEISTRGDGAPPARPTWPHFLSCSDTEIGEVERWLADTDAEFPEVLRG